MLKLGCVPYMNALPLTYSLDPKEVELIHRPPAELLKLLQEGQVEAALLPIVNYFENPDLYLVPGLAIACRGAVKSVKLYFVGANPCVRPEIEGRHIGLPLQNIHNIYLDPESRTSHALLKVILHHKYKIDLNTLYFTSDFNRKDLDANLLIGDKTFDQKDEGLDLGEEWCTWQKKPFVFAAWMAQSPSKHLNKILQEAYKGSFSKLEEIIEQIMMNRPVGTRLAMDTLREYFTKNIHYTMEGSELEGIRQFYKLLKPIQGYSHELDFKFVS